MENSSKDSDTPNNSEQLKDEVLAQLLDMGYDFDIAGITFDLVMTGDNKLSSVDEVTRACIALIEDQANEPLQPLPQQIPQQVPPKPARINVAASSQTKGILKSPVTSQDKGFFANAASWFSKTIPTSVTTLGNTIVNKIAPVIPEPSIDTRIYKSTLDRRPKVRHDEEDWDEQGTLARSRKVRFSSENINIEPESPLDELESPIDSEPKPQPVVKPATPSSPVESPFNLGYLGPTDVTVQDLEKPSDVLEFYMMECDRRREQPIEKLIDEIKAQMDTEVKQLDLSNSTLDKNNVLPLSDLLGCRFGLTTLSLENCHLDDDSTKALLNNLLAVDTVTHLNLAGNRKLSNIGIKYICIYLKKSKSLKSLDLSRSLIDKTSCAYLSHALIMGPVAPTAKPSEAMGSGLEVLKLDDCKIKTPQLLQALLPGVVMSNLVQLSLKKNGLDASCAPWLAEMMKPDDELMKFKAARVKVHGDAVPRRRFGLRSLDLSENPIGQGVGLIAQALCLNSVLRHLELREVEMDSQGLATFAEMLSVNKGLKSLDISSNPIGVASNAPMFEALKNGLGHNNTLQSLSLANTMLSSENCIVLAEALPLSKLTSLDLSGNPMELAGVMAVSAAVKSNTTLTQCILQPLVKPKSTLRNRSILEVEAGSDLEKMLQEVSKVLEKNVKLAKKAQEEREKALQEKGMTVEEEELLLEEEEEAEMAKEAQLEEERKQLLLQEQRRAHEEAMFASGGIPRIPDRGYDEETLRKELTTLKGSWQVLQEMTEANKGVKDDLLDALYLQCSELRSRLLAAINDDLVKVEDLKKEILEVNELVGPTLEAIADANSGKPKKHQPNTSKVPLKSAMKKKFQELKPEEVKPVQSMDDEEDEEVLIKKKPTSPIPASSGISRVDSLDAMLADVDVSGVDAEDVDKFVEDIDEMLAMDTKEAKEVVQEVKKGKKSKK